MHARRAPRISLGHVPSPYGRLRMAYIVVSLAMFASMVLHAFGHMALAGFRLGRTDDADDGALLTWPIVDVPAWSILLGTAAGCILLVALSVLADRPAAMLDLPWLAALGVAGLVGPSMAFGTWFGDASGVAITWNDEALRAGTTIGLHAALAPVAFALLVAVVVRGELVRRRLLRSGTTQADAEGSRP